MNEKNFTISLNGLDNVGKTTQLKYMPENIQIRYDDFINEIFTKNNLNEWYYEHTTHEECINIIMSNVNKRYYISNNDNTNLIVFDRGSIMFEAICIVIIALKDKCDLKEAKNNYNLIMEKLGIKNPLEDIRILLKHDHNLKDSVERTLIHEINSNETYKIYENLLEKQIEIQENENNYTHIINITNKSIIQIQNEIRLIINEYCFPIIKNNFPTILQNLELIINFNEISESGTSSLADGIYQKLQLIGIKCVHFKVEYFMELISNTLGYNSYQLSAEKQADELLKQFDHYYRQHYWIKVKIIENLHSFEITKALKYLLGDKFYIIHVDTILNTHIEHPLNKIKNIANFTINTDESTLNDSINHIFNAIIKENEKINIQFNSNIISTKKINLHSYQFVISAGTVLIRKSTHEICLICSLDGRNEWVLPKGRKNINETLSDAALRETYEETGYHCSLMPLTMQTRATPIDGYAEDMPREMNNACEPFFISIRPIKGDLTNRKLIFWYVAQVDEDVPREIGTQMIDENFEVKFVSLNEAMDLLPFDEDKELVQKALQLFQMTYLNN